MFTKLVSDVAPLVDDAELVRVIKEASDSTERPNAAGCYRIGIANEQGVIYRVVAGDDLHEFNDTHDALTAAGLVDRFEVGEASMGGFDAILCTIAGGAPRPTLSGMHAPARRDA